MPAIRKPSTEGIFSIDASFPAPKARAMASSKRMIPSNIKIPHFILLFINGKMIL